MMRNMRQNLFFAFIYNAIGIPVAAGLLYPFFGILVSPMIGGAAMPLSSVSVIGNALRLRALDLGRPNGSPGTLVVSLRAICRIICGYLVKYAQAESLRRAAARTIELSYAFDRITVLFESRIRA
jgi:hypothetical protein